MFGYVIPNQAALSPEAQARYRTAYCGLCRRIGALHGLRGRLTLSYDLTFLNLLLSSLYEGETEQCSRLRALPHPPGAEDPLAVQRPHGLLCRPERRAALLQRRRTSGRTTTASSALGLRNCWPPTAAGRRHRRWPRQCEAIRTCLDRLTQLEAKGSEDL